LGAISYPATGQSVQSVDYKSSGVILNIRPTIRAESIELDINQQISNFVQTTTGVNNSPTLIKREIATTVNCKNDDVIVLGGLEESSQTTASSGQSWLPNFLRSKSKDESKSDILLVLHVTKL
jgi:type II secretory pathway component GspD/PulD (secretin)